MAQTTATSGTLLNIGSKAAAFQHPTYVAFLPAWTKLAHVREGVGGFLDGTYLIPHPREWQDHDVATPVVPTKKLKARRALARYENFAATIIEAKKAALFREPPSRRVGKQTPEETKKKQKADTPPSAIEAWWQDVDGKGTPIDDFMAFAWDAAATFGHVVIYLDRPKVAPPKEGEVATAADTPRPYLRVYTPIDVLDWLTDDAGNLTGVKFQEAVERKDFKTPTSTNEYRLRLVDEKAWSVYSSKGAFTEGGTENGAHQLGALPVVVLFAQRRPLIPQVGQSVLYDPQNFVDLYNLTSEVRELLRNQTFSWINIPLGSGDERMSVEDAKAIVGTVTGTSNVLFSGLQAQILSADADNVVVYHAEITRLLRLIYRLAALQWESDSQDAEAEGSLKLKREDMNQRLSLYAGELTRAELAIAQLFYRATFGADDGPNKFKTDGVVIEYPDTFDMTPFAEVLAQAQAAMSLGMPTEVLKAIRKALLVKFLPNATPEEIEQFEAAIENAADDVSPADQVRMKLQGQSDAFGGGKKKDPPKKSSTGQSDPPKDGDK